MWKPPGLPSLKSFKALSKRRPPNVAGEVATQLASDLRPAPDRRQGRNPYFLEERVSGSKKKQFPFALTQARKWNFCHKNPGDGTNVTERAQNTDFRRKPHIFADSPVSWKFKHLEGAGNRRRPQIFAGNRRVSQKTTGNRRLGSVTLGPSPLVRS